MSAGVLLAATGVAGDDLEPFAQAVDVRAAAGEDLRVAEDVQAGAADDVGHEGVAGDQSAAGQGEGDHLQVHRVALQAGALGEGLEALDRYGAQVHTRGFVGERLCRESMFARLARQVF